MRSIPSMIADLRGLAKHIHGMDSGSGDAALLHDAANYIEGATGSLREHMALARTMRDALRIIAGEAPCPDNLLGNADIARIALHGK